MKNKITDADEIRRMGFEYAEELGRCQGHAFNDIPINLDFGDRTYDLEKVEKEIDQIFIEVLKSEMKDAGVKKVRSIEWDRYFSIPKLWKTNKFSARYYIRIVSEDEKRAVVLPKNVCLA